MEADARGEGGPYYTGLYKTTHPTSLSLPPSLPPPPPPCGCCAHRSFKSYSFAGEKICLSCLCRAQGEDAAELKEAERGRSGRKAKGGGGGVKLHDESIRGFPFEKRSFKNSHRLRCVAFPPLFGLFLSGLMSDVCPPLLLFNAFCQRPPDSLHF